MVSAQAFRFKMPQPGSNLRWKGGETGGPGHRLSVISMFACGSGLQLSCCLLFLVGYRVSVLAGVGSALRVARVAQLGPSLQCSWHSCEFCCVILRRAAIGVVGGVALERPSAILP